MPAPLKRIVIGIGNPDRGDDAAGRAVARRLRGLLPPSVAVREHNGEAAALLAMLDGAAVAVLIDACALGAPTGTVHRFDAAVAALPRAGFALSSHGIGAAEAIELARALGQLPPHCILYAIEGASFEQGAALSVPVSQAVAAVARRLRRELAGERKVEGKPHA
jgi:hydrogenase maturation protease